MGKVILAASTLVISSYSLLAKPSVKCNQYEITGSKYNRYETFMGYGNSISRKTTDTTSFSDSIVRLKFKSGYYDSYKGHYSYKGRIVNDKDVKKIMKLDDSAYKIFRKSGNTGFIASVLAFLGGAFIAIPIENLLEAKKADWTPAAIGVGIELIAFSFGTLSDHQLDRAISIFNQGIHSRSMIHKELKFGITSNGIGVCLRF